jgi:hypothetical protein
MTLSFQQQQFSRDTVDLFNYIHEKGYSFTYGEAMRSDEHAAFFAIDGMGILDSLHRKRLAIDINIFSPEGKYLQDTQDYEQFGIYWESLSCCNRWGGRFNRKDGNHFERKLSQNE